MLPNPMWYMEEIRAENGIRNHIAHPIRIQNLQWYTEFALFHIPLQRTGKPILAENGIKSELHVKIR